MSDKTENKYSAQDKLIGSTQRNLRRLFILRSLSISAQALMIFVASYWLALPLPFAVLSTILIIHSLWNGFTLWRAHQSRDVSDAEFFWQILTDVFALTGVLYLTGGASNPFVGLYLLPLMITATVLPKRFVWSMAAISIICYSVLVFFFVPLNPDVHMHHNSVFSQHVFGMWFSFVFSAGLVAYFVTNMAHTIRKRDRVLAEAREQVLRDERIVALGTLAAGAAHELGTPLNTMAIVTDELQQQLTDQENADLNEQLLIISEQIGRCKNALSVISASAGELRASSGKPLAVDQYLQQLLNQWQTEHPEIHLKQILNGKKPASQLVADRALDQAIINILNNAADVSPDWVEFKAEWKQHDVTLEIRDHGPGFSPNVKINIGKLIYSDKEHGLGVGLFLAHSVIDRMGGKVTIFNDELGSCTCIDLPLLSV